MKNQALESHYHRINECINKGGQLREMYAELMHVSILQGLGDFEGKIDLLIEEINHQVNELHGIANSLKIVRQMVHSEKEPQSGAV